MLFRIRVDELNHHVHRQLIKMLTGHEHVLVKHVLPHGNPHYHAYADLPYNFPSALRYHLDKECHIPKGSGHARSVKECEPTRKDEYIQYLFNTKKGNIWTIVSSTVDTTEHQAKAATVAEEFAAANPPKEKKDKGPTMWDIAMETHQLFVLTHTGMPSAQFPSDVHREYARCAIQVCRKYRKGFCEYTLQKIVQTAMTEHEAYKELVVNALVRRLKPREEFQ